MSDRSQSELYKAPPLLISLRDFVLLFFTAIDRLWKDSRLLNS
ncbi:hypothetical protein CASFOL_033075 [Castilleja foliolosa]|uniref:Uncharacterized protein n=1 Tax=Castilleja foliolosa TaxID=1961234 RepID=A0ABD3C477_9LAMI